MKAHIGIVCEGSHDFLFMEPIIQRHLQQKGYIDIKIEAVQPKIDATSKQIDGGGWAAVEQWCVSNSSARFDSYFDQPLFASSVTYDAIIVHLDGDVVDVSNKFLPLPIFLNVADRVMFLENWIGSLVSPSIQNRASLLFAIPVLHTEAWIMTALKPESQNIEGRPQKKRTKALMWRRLKGGAISQVERAARLAAGQMAAIRMVSVSFDRFVQNLDGRF